MAAHRCVGGLSALGRAVRPRAQDFDAILQPPSLAHLFGTDNLGRDIFSRVLYGARLDLTAGFVMTFVPMTYGVLIGAFAGYRGGWLDKAVAGIVDTAIAFPFLVMIIVVVAVLGPGLQTIYISVFLLAWTMYARLARADMMVERAKDYMLAARVLGYPTRVIVLRHGLPNAIASSIVFAMSDFILNILLLSGLSFIGLGVQPPTPGMGRNDRRGQGVHPAGLVDLHHAGPRRGAHRHRAEHDRRWPGPALRRPARGSGDERFGRALLEIEDLERRLRDAAGPPARQ